jgi:hypothetical protein
LDCRKVPANALDRRRQSGEEFLFRQSSYLKYEQIFFHNNNFRICAAYLGAKDWKDITSEVSFPAGTRHGSIFKLNKQEFEKWLGKNK